MAQLARELVGLLNESPRRLTPVCTTELGRVAQLKEEWAKKNVKVAIVSVDNVEDHLRWIGDIETSQNCKVDFPIIDGKDLDVPIKYAMLDQTHKPKGMPQTLRSLFIICPRKYVKLIMTYPSSCGRNFDEVLRVIDSLQLTYSQQIATPVDWKQGSEVVISPSCSDEAARTKFPGYRTVLPYLRMADAPSVCPHAVR